ncbi:crocetin glucosyltransferase [Forsythia ovata]|uniref:Crocetin glucosyltransferase n=1 Tax=Forsythia ovata TaxID=205694 RepID=A0ABD1SK47_9LAMI
MKSLPTINGLSYASFSNENDNDYQSSNGFSSYVSSLRSIGSQKVMHLMEKFFSDGEPMTLLVYIIILPWVDVVARDCVPLLLPFITASSIAKMVYMAEWIHWFR